MPAKNDQSRDEVPDPLSFASIFSALKPIDQRISKLDRAINYELNRMADLRQHIEQFRASLVSEVSELEWELYGRFEAEKTARTLKSRPGETVLKLKMTLGGIDLLLDKWHRLEGILRSGGTWSEAQSRLALDLLSTPVEFRDGDTEIDFPAGTNLTEARIQLVQQEVDCLKKLKADLVGPRDARRFELAQSGAILLPDEAFKRLQGEIKNCEKALKWASIERTRLLKLKTEEPIDTETPKPMNTPASEAKHMPEVKVPAQDDMLAILQDSFTQAEQHSTPIPVMSPPTSDLRAGTETKDIYPR